MLGHQIRPINVDAPTPMNVIVPMRRSIGAVIAAIVFFTCASLCSASTPYTGTAIAEPGNTIPCSNFDNGVSGDAYVASHPVPSGQNTSYRNTPVPMNTTTDTGGNGYVVGISTVGGDYMYPGDWVVYTTHFATAGIFDIGIRCATASTGRYAHIEVDGTNVTGSLPLPATSDWGTYATAVASAVPISAGTHVIKLEVDNPVGLINFNWLSFATHVTHTYYVSPNGNDNNNGTSTSTPWKTAAKVDSTVFQPGDTVLFQRGGTWREQLIASGSGNPSSPITFADYGTGNKPIFSGSDILPNASFSPAGNPNEYQISDPTTVNSVLVNHVFLQTNGDPDTTLNTWSYSNGILKINVATNPNTDGNVYTACTRVNELYSNGYNDLVYRNLVAEDTALLDDGYCVRAMGSTKILYDSCEAYYGGKHNFGCINSTQVVYKSCVAGYEMPGQGSGGATLYVSYADTDPAGLNAATSEYDDCIADNMQDTSSPGAYYQSFVCHGAELGLTTFNNFSTNYGLFAVLQDSGATNQVVRFNGGTINNASFELYTTAAIVDGTTFTGNSAVDCYGTGNIFQNLKMSILPSNGGQTGYNSAFVMRSGAKNNVIRFCTVVMDPTSANNWPCLTLVASGTATSWYGNIFYSTNAPVIPYYYTPTSADVGNTDYNFYNPNPQFCESNTTETLAQWQAATGADKHSLTGNPLFVNQSAENYNLQSTSPAINAAPIPSSFFTGLPPNSTDYNGNPRESGSTYDMGAFEYQTAAAPPVITSANTASGNVNSAFSYQITATNSPTSYSATGLPNGLTVNTASGLISGTPTATGTSSVKLGATNNAGTGNETLSITINAAVLQKPSITSPTKASADVGQAFTYVIRATNSPTSYSASNLPSGLTVNTTNGHITGTPTTGGTVSVTIGATNSVGTGTATLQISVKAPPTITSKLARTAIIGTSFTYKITATGTPTSYAAAPLPAGLTVNTQTGQITGTPTTKGKTSVTISATNGAGTGSATLVLTVNPAPKAPVISSPTAATGTVGASFSYQITASGSPTSFNATGLPAGLTVSTTTGLISGTPTTAGTSAVTLSAKNAGGTGTEALTLTINQPAPVITSSTTASGNVGTAFTYQITASNSPTSYNATGLPSGLAVNTSTGAITGTPTKVATSSVTIRATNTGGTGTATLMITIAAHTSAHITGSLSGPPSGTVNLTTEGTLDWGHWGAEGSGNWDHKSGGNLLGWSANQTCFTYNGTPASYLWTDGSSNWNGQAQSNGFYFNGANFTVTAPADTTTRTLKFYLGSFGGTGTLTASLSDGSAPNYVNSSLPVSTHGVYTIVYAAASAGQTLTVTWGDSSGGRLDVQSATLH